MMNSSQTMNETQCCYRGENDAAIIQAFTFWVEGVFTTVVGVLGLFGNTLSISVLRGKEMRNNTFNLLLVVLATVDSFLIIFAIFDYSIIRAFALNIGELYSYLFTYFLYPFTNVVLCYSIFLVLAIAFERFLAVCHPYEYRAISSTQSVNGRVAKLTVPVFILALAINLPKFFETEVVEQTVPGTNQTAVTVVVTELRKDPTYINVYINWANLLATGVIPMGVLIYLNVNIYMKIVETKKSRALMGQRHEQQPTQQNQTRSRSPEASSPGDVGNHPPEAVRAKKKEEVSKKDIRMAIILLTIVLVFFSCHLPRVLLNLHEFFMVSRMIECGSDAFCPPTWFLCAITFSHLFLVINSSVNLLIYCSVGEKFRQGLKAKLRYDTFHRLWQRYIGSGHSPPDGLEDEASPQLMYEVAAPREMKVLPRAEVSLAKHLPTNGNTQLSEV